MTDMVGMTKVEVLAVWKGFVRNMTDQGAVFPFANEIARRVRAEVLARLDAADAADARACDYRDDDMDIVTKMRLAAEDMHAVSTSHHESVRCLSLGADEIVRLRAKIEYAREAIAKATEVKP